MVDKNFSELVSRILPAVPKCPQATIIKYARDAAIKICELTLSWRYETPTYILLPGVHEYAFNTPSTAEVHGIIGFLLNNTQLCPLTLDQAIAAYPQWANLFSGEDAEEVWSETPGGYIGADVYDAEEFNAGSDFVLPDSIVAEGGTPVVYVMVSPQRYIVLPLPDGTEYTARQFLALKPLRDATAMDKSALEEIEDAVVYKTLEDLMMLQQTPWFNPELAQANGRKAVWHTLERRARANIGHVRGSMQVRAVNWA